MSSSNFHPNPGQLPALIILAGLPGAGKTTFAHKMLDVLPAVHVESDAIRRGLTNAPLYTMREHAWVFASAEELARAALAAEQNVILDATNLTRKDRRRFMKLANAMGVAVVGVHVSAPEEVIRERLSRAREGFSQANVAVFEIMAGTYQPFAAGAIEVDGSSDLSAAMAAVVGAVQATRD